MNEKYCDKIVEYIIKFDYETDVLLRTRYQRDTSEKIMGYRLFDSTVVEYPTFFYRLQPIVREWIISRLREKYGNFTNEEIDYIMIELRKRMDSIRHNKLMNRLLEELNVKVT